MSDIPQSYVQYRKAYWKQNAELSAARAEIAARSIAERDPGGILRLLRSKELECIALHAEVERLKSMTTLSVVPPVVAATRKRSVSLVARTTAEGKLACSKFFPDAVGNKECLDIVSMQLHHYR